MPIYEYKCSNCNKKHEKLHKSYDELLLKCPNCNLLTLKKLVSASKFKLKGTGWYITDFKNKEHKNTKK